MSSRRLTGGFPLVTRAPAARLVFKYLMYTHGSVGPLLASVLAGAALHVHVHAVDDVEKVFHHRHFFVLLLKKITPQTY